MFILYINDLPEILKNGSEIYLYADDTKIYRQIKTQDDMKLLQEDIDCMREWSEKWLLVFHPKKCKSMRIGNCNVRNNGYSMNEKITETSSEKDIGVIIDSKLQFSNHLIEKVLIIFSREVAFQ